MASSGMLRLVALVRTNVSKTLSASIIRVTRIAELVTTLVFRIASSGMVGCVALVRTDVSKKLSASIIRVTRIGELGRTLAVTKSP
jgi:hypothetical protein